MSAWFGTAFLVLAFCAYLAACAASGVAPTIDGILLVLAIMIYLRLWQMERD
ncbi:hypothetical protein SLG_21830 [Sphingobium sp. SYK-6]|uniref:hypothetical protein n=1 Tax=Sphingobium sp. (strain NBRC 103272 / SYK-6) TaxID=627192 RepID=UPI00022770B2|nr:hypothetical protein [Sphingobium sp. SYK-6]BAK66858.1 hypothetical protein SLG_21830 [Sphingobium sp. SYK-6]